MTIMISLFIGFLAGVATICLIEEYLDRKHDVDDRYF